LTFLNITSNILNRLTKDLITLHMNNGKRKNTKEKGISIKVLKERIKKCEKERDEHLLGWKRARADFINYKKEEAENPGIAVIDVAKNRNGPQGRLNLKFIGHYTRFENIDNQSFA